MRVWVVGRKERGESEESKVVMKKHPRSTAPALREMAGLSLRLPGGNNTRSLHLITEFRVKEESSGAFWGNLMTVLLAVSLFPLLALFYIPVRL